MDSHASTFSLAIEGSVLELATLRAA
jgi:hypothetical protein